jgi:hypothetical protein
MSTLTQRRKLRKGYKTAVATSPPGGGKRFAALEKVAAAGGATNPGAVAAAIGRKKWGKQKMAKWSAQGRKNK